MATGSGDETTAVVLTDEEIVTQFCLQNKVSKTATDELLKRGFTSLEALKLVQLDDLSSEKIPRGQRRLIQHIVQSLMVQDEAAVTPTEPTGNTNAGANDDDVLEVQITQEGNSEQAVQNGKGAPNEQATVYKQLIDNLLSQQQTVIKNSQASASVGEPTTQPSWNDPQIHISSASGKSATSYLDICDFVQSSVEEEVVLGGQGDQQVIVKSGPRKPRLEGLTLCQWSVANLSILYKLVGENKLVGNSLMDYLSYTTKVYQLVQRYSLVSVLLFDREYRKLQSSMGFRWGTDVQHLHTLFLQPRDKPTAAGGQLPKKGTNKVSGQKFGKNDKEKGETPICRSFNSQKGCTFQNCRYRHSCLLPGCSQKHSAQSHVNEKN